MQLRQNLAVEGSRQARRDESVEPILDPGKPLVRLEVPSDFPSPYCLLPKTIVPDPALVDELLEQAVTGDTRAAREIISKIPRERVEMFFGEALDELNSFRDYRPGESPIYLVFSQKLSSISTNCLPLFLAYALRDTACDIYPSERWEIVPDLVQIQRERLRNFSYGEIERLLLRPSFYSPALEARREAAAAFAILIDDVVGLGKTAAEIMTYLESIEVSPVMIAALISDSNKIQQVKSDRDIQRALAEGELAEYASEVEKHLQRNGLSLSTLTHLELRLLLKKDLKSVCRYLNDRADAG